MVGTQTALILTVEGLTDVTWLFNSMTPE